jgi:hypothetical protein
MVPLSVIMDPAIKRSSSLKELESISREEISYDLTQFTTIYMIGVRKSNKPCKI